MAKPREPGTKAKKDSAQWSPLATAAIVGGAAAATAGAYFGTRALARRNARADGKPLNSVMAAAITACDVAHQRTEDAPSAAEILVGSDES